MAARTKMTPPYGVVGLWQVNKPYKISEHKEYRCTAIRSFVELQIAHIDVYDSFYVEYELEESVFVEDGKIGASIITLLSTDGETIHVPDTFIKKYPDMSTGAYRRFVLSCDLGTLPKNTPLTHIQNQISTEITKSFGRKVKVNIHTGDIKHEELTPAERHLEEVNRNSKAKPRTVYGDLQAANKRYSDLQEAYAFVVKQLAKRDNQELDLNAKKNEVSTLASRVGELSGQVASLTIERDNLLVEKEKNDAYIAKLVSTIQGLRGQVPPRE